MAYQLVYTSSPKGLKPGAFGFCVVACTRGMKEQTAAALEALSGYRRVYSDPQSALRNPVSCSHILFDTPTGRLRVLARVADAGLDYSGRTNMIASFFEVAANELVAPGPAALFSQPGLFVERWTPADAPRYFETPAALPNVVMIPRGCDEWRRATGSAAWAGVLASTVATRRPVTLVVRPDQNVLRLFQEAIALLPPSERWNATFSTYYMKTPPGVVCQWKAAMQGSPEELALRSAPGALTINLANPSLLPSPDSLATTPQALRLVAEATGVASSDPLQRPASGKLPGARPSALSGAASIGVPNVAEIPEPRGEGYALQPQEVSVPNGASGRKKLNYGRDVVLKVDVPKTRRTSGKSLTTKLLIYALVFCLLLVSSVLVLWFAGPLRDVVKGIETRNEAVNEVNGTAGEPTETPKPDGADASVEGGAPSREGPPNPEPSTASDDTSPHSEDSVEANQESMEKDLAKEFNAFVENHEPGEKPSFASDLRKSFEEKFEKYGSGTETSELINAIAYYDFWQAFDFNDGVIWSPAEIKNREDSGLFIEGKKLYNAFEKFFSRQKGQTRLIVRFEEGLDTGVGLDFSVADLSVPKKGYKTFGDGDARFFVDHNTKKVGLWFKTRNELLQYAKKQMVLTASTNDDDAPNANKSLRLPLSHFKVSGDSEGKELDLKWLSGGDGESLPEIQNVTPRQDTLYFEVATDKNNPYSVAESKDRDNIVSKYIESKNVEGNSDSNEKEKYVVLTRKVKSGEKEDTQLAIFLFKTKDNSSILVGEFKREYKKSNEYELDFASPSTRCEELCFDVRLRTGNDNKNPLTVGRIKVPLRAEKEHEDNNVER